MTQLTNNGTSRATGALYEIENLHVEVEGREILRGLQPNETAVVLALENIEGTYGHISLSDGGL